MMSAPQPSLPPALEGLVEPARESFRQHGAASIQGVLEEGLAAELANYLVTRPYEPRLNAEHHDLSWAYEMGVPQAYDPQHPACLYQLVSFLDGVLPAIATAVTGRELAPVMRRRVHVWVFHRGAHVDDGKPLAPVGGVDVVLGLTAPRWPSDWGGHLEVGDQVEPLGFGVLHLLERGFRVPLLTRHVRGLAVRSILRPA